MIPVENIYYLLCYAWDKLAQKDLVPAGTTGQKDIYALLLTVLLKELPRLSHQGYHTDYQPQRREVQGIKGKLLLTPSLKNQSFLKGYAHCSYHHLTNDTLPNRVLRSTLVRVLQVKNLPADVHKGLVKALHNMPAFSPITLDAQVLQQALAMCHRKSHYLFVLHICALLHSQSMLAENGNALIFKDFERDERKMALLFEAFVRNFYKIELKSAKVFRERLQWKLTGTEPQYLPKMQTDISLILNDGKKLIIDTKYYARTLNTYFSSEKIHTENLYQLFAYLKNQPDEQAEGILLYPTVKQSLSLSYTSEQHQIRIETINLAQPWEKIHEDLLEIVTKNLPQIPYSFD